MPPRELIGLLVLYLWPNSVPVPACLRGLTFLLPHTRLLKHLLTYASLPPRSCRSGSCHGHVTLSLLKSKDVGRIYRERQYSAAILHPQTKTISSVISLVTSAQSPRLTSPTLPHPARCPSLLQWCTLSRTGTRPTLGYACVSCPCWRRVSAPRRSPLMGLSWFSRRGRRLLRACWWSVPSTCRTPNDCQQSTLGRDLMRKSNALM